MSVRNTLALSSIFLLAASGCFNRQGGLSGPFSRTARVAPPPTNQLQFPTLAKQPYYVPEGTLLAQNNGAAIPNQGSSIVNPVINPPNPIQPQGALAAKDLNGWKQIPNNGMMMANPSNPNGPPTYQTPYVLASNIPNQGSAYQVASSTAVPDFVRAQKDSKDYQSTVKDERRDPSRLAATDATAVRSPGQPLANIPVNRGSIQRYDGNVRFAQGDNPNRATGGSQNGFNNPNDRGTIDGSRFAGPSGYQSPYVRQGNPAVYRGQFQGGAQFNGQGMQTGWVPRDSNGTQRQ